MKAKPAKIKSFVKWVGGKSNLVKTLDKFMPRDVFKMKNLVYVEPFVGGGSMLFHMLKTYPNIKKAIINDINADLINCYNVIKNYPEILIQILKSIDMIYKTLDTEAERKKFFEQKKKMYNEKGLTDIENAAIFIFLNKTCFNGLYRVNKKGKFNVPFGRYKNPCICDEDLIRNDSKLLQNVSIICGDYKRCYDLAKPYMDNGDEVLFYFDPPYRPISKTSCFTGFDKSSFGDKEQTELCELCRTIDFNDGMFILSNSDGYSVDPKDTFLIDLYNKFNIEHIVAPRNINSKGDKRAKVSELVIYNYNLTKSID